MEYISKPVVCEAIIRPFIFSEILCIYIIDCFEIYI